LSDGCTGTRINGQKRAIERGLTMLFGKPSKRHPLKWLSIFFTFFTIRLKIPSSRISLSKN
jgi:hypothetical protein